jgi:hypothetical protein
MWRSVAVYTSPDRFGPSSSAARAHFLADRHDSGIALEEPWPGVRPLEYLDRYVARSAGRLHEGRREAVLRGRVHHAVARPQELRRLAREQDQDGAGILRRGEERAQPAGSLLERAPLGKTASTCGRTRLDRDARRPAPSRGAFAEARSMQQRAAGPRPFSW